MQIASLVSSLARVPRFDPSLTVLIYDRRLETVSPEFRAFARRFPARYAVRSGEPLKDLASFPAHCSKLATMCAAMPARRLTVVACGGGSVGDFAGFFASVYKRGVRLVHLPSTWLAAIDSAHGGKTALNVGGVKNQIGTFYPGETILVRSLLPGGGARSSRAATSLVHDAMGEFAKIAMIDGRPWVRELERSRLEGFELLWKYLGNAVDSKMRVVRKDPREETGVRQVLNLGHTMGHVAESALGLSHGESVAQGLFFALEFSRHTEMLSEPAFERAMTLMGSLGLVPKPVKVSARNVERLLLQDKKRSSKKTVTFILLRRFGRPERCEFAIADIMSEARRQGWIA